MRIVFLLLVLSSCVGKSSFTSDGINVVINNDSGDRIDTIHVSTSEKYETLIFQNLDDLEQDRAFLRMDSNKVDGSYKVDWLHDGVWRTISAGYYTNGYPLNREMIVRIKGDSIATQFEMGGSVSPQIRFKKGILSEK